MNPSHSKTANNRSFPEVARRASIGTLALLLGWGACALPVRAALLVNLNPAPDPPNNSVLVWNGSQLVTGPGAVGNGDGGVAPVSQVVGGLQLQTPFSITDALSGYGRTNNLDGSTTFNDTTLVLTGLTLSAPGQSLGGIFDLQPLNGGTFQIFASATPVFGAGQVGNHGPLLLQGTLTDASLGGFHNGVLAQVYSATLTYTAGLIFDKLVAGNGTLSGTVQFNLLLNNGAHLHVDPGSPDHISPFGADAQALFDTPRIPEPTSFVLGAIALGGLIGFHRLRKRRQRS